MKIQSKILLMLALWILLFLGGIILIRHFENESENLYLQDKQKEKIATFDKLLILKSNSLQGFTYDTTYWDDMVNFIRHPDPVWAEQNLLEGVKAFKLTGFWLFDLKCRQIYSNNILEDPELKRFPLAEIDLAKLFSRKYFNHFFIETPRGVMEVYTAPIQPTADSARLTPPHGYFIAGHLWDDEYLKELSELTDCRIKMLPANQKNGDSYDRHSGIISFSKTIYDWENRPFNIISAQSEINIVKQLNILSNYRFNLSFLFVLAFFLLLAFLLIKWVSKPLNLMSESLNREKPALLNSLQKDSSELGQLARLIKQFFRQKDDLIKENQERKKAEEKLEKALEEITRSNQELELFASVASHDLQEPLRMVRSFLQLLSRRYQDKLDGDALDYINFAVDGAARMQSLIDELLVYSRVDTKGNAFVETELSEVIEKSINNLQVAVQENQAVIKISENLPQIKADPGQLIQLYQNLIANAIKFHGKTNPEIEIGFENRKADWLFFVKDNGIGFDPKNAEKIFQIFYRLHGQIEYAGSGIGLAVCKKIVERHGGAIWATSKPGEGSVFYFTILKNPPAKGK